MKKIDLENAEPPQGNSNAKAQMAVMHDFGFPVCTEVSGLGMKIWHKKKIHMDLILLSLKLKHEFGIYLTLVASKDPFNVSNGSKVMSRKNSFTKLLKRCSIC